MSEIRGQYYYYSNNPLTWYHYHPSIPGNVVGCAVFAVILILSTAFSLWTRDIWLLILFGLGGGLELAGYICRTLNAVLDDSLGAYTAQEVCITIAPLFIFLALLNQGVKARIIFGEGSFSRAEPILMILLGILTLPSLILEAIGAGTSKHGPDKTRSSVLLGGLGIQIGIQVGFLLLLGVNYIYVFKDTSREDKEYEERRRKPLFRFWIPSVLVSLIFLTISVVYRLVLASLIDTGPEVVFFMLDGFTTAVSMATLIVVPPGVAHGRLKMTSRPYADFSKEGPSSTLDESYEPFVPIDWN